MNPPELMFDSTDANAIPAYAKLVLTYIDGKYQTDAAVAKRLPNARRIPTTTTVTGSLAAIIYDCERGDGNAQQAAAWAKRKLALRMRPTIYCSRIGSPGFGWQDVRQALYAEGIALPLVDFGIADYLTPYTLHLVPGSAFTQFANPPTSGGNYDVSVTDGVWPNVTPNPITHLKGLAKMQPIVVGNYLVTNVAVNGHLVQIRQDVSSIGSPSTGDNTKIIDLTDQWPQELTGVTGG